MVERQTTVESNITDRKPHGLTGIVGKDGVLSPEKQQRLDTLQSQTAIGVMDRLLMERKPGDFFPLVHMATGIGKGRIIHKAIEEQKRLKPDSRILVLHPSDIQTSLLTC